MRALRNAEDPADSTCVNRFRRTQTRAWRVIAGAVGLFVLAPSAIAAESDLRVGNAAFETEDFDRAIAAYENEASEEDRLTRRFNAGVSWIRKGVLDTAIERFEDVSARATGELRASSLYNLGWAHFEKARTVVQTVGELETIDEKIERLTESVRSYRSSLEFFRRITPPTDAATKNIVVAKTALRSALDQLARLEEEKRRAEENALLDEPAQLIRKLIATERGHRMFSRSLASEPQRRRRLPCRRLRKSTAENRRLAELLHHHVSKEPESTDDQPPPAEEERQRLAGAAAALTKAIDAMKGAEIDYGKLDAKRATESHTTAIRALREAALAFPLEIPQLIAEGVATQESVLAATEALDGKTPNAAAGNTPIGVGEMVLDALKSKVLSPIAKFLTPKPVDEAEALADEEEEVVWISTILTQVEIPPTPPQPEGGPPPGPNAPPPLDEAEARELSEALRREGTSALESAQAASRELRAVALAAAAERGRSALAALERARDLLPQRPKTVEEQLAELIGKQHEARTAASSLESLAEDERAGPAGALVESQGRDGVRAGEIASELETREGDERATRAAAEVRSGEREIFSSAEALRRSIFPDTVAAIDRDLAHLTEALKILRGEDQNEGEDEQNQPQQPDSSQSDPNQSGADQNQDSGDDGEQNQPRSMYRLSAAKAKEEREKMDQKRREEQAKIFSGGASVTVEKDW